MRGSSSITVMRRARYSSCMGSSSDRSGTSHYSMVYKAHMATTFDALLTELFGSTTQPLARQCAIWLRSSRRFRAFVETYRDKIRKKAGVARDEEACRDLEC